MVESGRIGKQHSTIWNGERTGKTARWSAPEALPQTPPGGKPPETPGPFPSDLIVGAERDPSRVRQPRQKTRALDRSLSARNKIHGSGKGAYGRAACLSSLPTVGPDEWVQTREGEIVLDKTDLLMEETKI
jgi:hypothetical protein